MTDKLIPSQVAATIGTDASTIRRWCTWHSAHLSEGANPGPGGQRQLTAQDVEVLRRVKELRTQGLQTPAINESLAGVTFAVIESPEQSTQESPGQAIAPTPTALAMVEALQSTLAPLNARVEALEAQRLRVDVVWIAVATFIAGLIVGLSVWWFQ